MLRFNMKTLALLVGLLLQTTTANAATCSAAISDINFGSISVRAGAANETSGSVNITCSGVVGALIGVCIKIGPGGGGAASSNSPRYMRNGLGGNLNYELRPIGSSATNGTWNEVYVNIPVVLGSATVSIPIYASITSNSVAVDTGAYSSVFSGVSDASITYGLLSCGLLGTEVDIPEFEVAAEVVPSCELDVTAMDFGSLPTPMATAVDETATVNVRCTNSTNYSVTLDQGLNGGSGPADRRMKNSSYELSYGLYRDVARSAPWGALATNDVDSTGIGANQSFTIYGRIPAGQSAYYGTYSDSVVVTVNY
ncbi:Csu type fimbrial protein [Neptunicoccus cionae]|uniref:Spore coat protein U/FanG domain-containing protein n=1 Tax=Neptunicoccus cionae TaxID=2035344 RepID=A0A916VPH6_9RHOB|nr:spore coat U domain-containing protein [Amylibacter cionae]GGA16754.1 hypothetical protein GCM10011498_16620 [Amylibacter cionae]